MKNKLAELIKENPTLEVIPATHYRVCPTNIMKYWTGEIEKVQIEYIYNVDGFDIIGFDNIMDKIYKDNYEENYEMYSDGEYNDFVNDIFGNEIYNNSIWKAIVIYINL